MTTINFIAGQLARPAERPLSRTGKPAPLQTSVPRSNAGWLDRLAAWAERQPMHRRVGSYTAI